MLQGDVELPNSNLSSPCIVFQGSMQFLNKMNAFVESLDISSRGESHPIQYSVTANSLDHIVLSMQSKRGKVKDKKIPLDNSSASAYRYLLACSLSGKQECFMKADEVLLWWEVWTSAVQMQDCVMQHLGCEGNIHSRSPYSVYEAGSRF